MVYEVRGVTADARMQSVAPVLLVKDVMAAAAYYRDQLGFEYEYFYGNPASFCIVHRDVCCVMLREVEDAKHVVPHCEVVSEMWNVYVWVDDVDQMFKEMKVRGAEMDGEIVTRPYGVREFGVRDLDGYGIRFGMEVR
ncbi:VOC family protein [Poriferisphaera sp. WC338]|uniref:VOC family protein n=1 Tax=Poriferisphaera sp. WC338 TaxID=3425129 RepID=UPI003D81B778